MPPRSQRPNAEIVDGLFGILVQFRPQATRAVQGRSSAMATYAYDQIDQARAALNAVSK